MPDAIYAFLTALVIALALTPFVGRLARRIGAIDLPGGRGLATVPTPRLGGLAILVAAATALLIWLPWNAEHRSILLGAIAITVVGAIDDIWDLPAGFKLIGQLGAAAIPVTNGVVVHNFTLPFVHHVDLGENAGVITLIGIVGVINAVNFSDGVDGLAAGVCSISAAAFAIIAFDLQKRQAGVLSALIAGAALGFLFHNFHPASVFMGDSGSNLLGLLLGCVMVEGTLKTNALIALLFPLVVLAVPFLDTGFVVAKRLKYRRAVYRPDMWHFHHRFAAIGFSQRRTVLYLYVWTFILAGVAVALRFVPYSDHHGHFHLIGSLVMGGLFLIALAASAYLIWVLEILKLRGIRAEQLRGHDPETAEHEIDAAVARDLETGEFPAIR